MADAIECDIRRSEDSFELFIPYPNTRIFPKNFPETPLFYLFFSKLASKIRFFVLEKGYLTMLSSDIFIIFQSHAAFLSFKNPISLSFCSNLHLIGTKKLNISDCLVFRLEVSNFVP